MSHFTVLVIGESPEEQLAPFHQFECTGKNDKYVQEIDRTEECKRKYEDTDKTHSLLVYIKDYYGWEPAFGEKDIDLDGKHKYGYMLLSDNGKELELIKCIDRTNPNYKWDWYLLGGRWAGFFNLKQNQVGVQGHHRAKDFARINGDKVADLPKTVADQCLKSAIDFDLMRNEAGEKAKKQYEFAMTFLDGLPVNKAWSIIGKEMNYTVEARETYWSQPRCVAWKAKDAEMGYKEFPFSYQNSPDDFLCTKEEYIENARNSAVSTYAVIKDGKWYEKGEMGWWCAVHNEKEDSTWNAEFTKLIDDLPDDTLLSVFDCHI